MQTGNNSTTCASNFRQIKNTIQIFKNQEMPLTGIQNATQFQEGKNFYSKVTDSVPN